MSWVSSFLWGRVLNTCHNVEVSGEATWIFDGLNNRVQQTPRSFLFSGIARWPRNRKMQIRFKMRGLGDPDSSGIFTSEMRVRVVGQAPTLSLSCSCWLILQKIKKTLKSRIMKFRSPQVSQSRVLLLNRQLSGSCCHLFAASNILHRVLSDALFLSRDGNIFCGKLGRIFLKDLLWRYSSFKHRLKIPREIICWVNPRICDVKLQGSASAALGSGKVHKLLQNSLFKFLLALLQQDVHTWSCSWEIQIHYCVCFSAHLSN